MQSSVTSNPNLKEFVPNWKLPWQKFYAGNIPRKGKPILFREISNSYFIGQIDSEGLINVSESGYVYSKTDGKIINFVYLDTLNDGIFRFPNLPEIGRELAVKDTYGNYFIGKLSEEGLIERSGTGYRYSIRDGFIDTWLYITCPLPQ
ncbi:hypothetical protein [Leptospira licerasiae]|uniref:WG repeat-containing protein n=1 Tax=Leptospira licerasiae str. MMD4847 TaxID=1049971 RepID=A0ABP2RIQ7_9LEPT|nr:hypothetical protein [Leptospira licerasiae]EIE01501.1 hypothetical protein LEP1GSC185_3955 [Leptospira licerasiae serovar Varillal str. VAR 010]EJZ42323.1 hypothetical protein LEP1GSC178_0023 [Leptospira licerasiae str. MMD4847]